MKINYTLPKFTIYKTLIILCLFISCDKFSKDEVSTNFLLGESAEPLSYTELDNINEEVGATVRLILEKNPNKSGKKNLDILTSFFKNLETYPNLDKFEENFSIISEDPTLVSYWFQGFNVIERLNDIKNVSLNLNDSCSNFVDNIQDLLKKLPRKKTKSAIGMIKTSLFKDDSTAFYFTRSGYDKNGKSNIDLYIASVKEEETIFSTHNAPTFMGSMRLSRNNDAEAKIFQYLAKELRVQTKDKSNTVLSEITGVVDLQLNLLPCGSCTDVIRQFSNMFPNVQINICSPNRMNFPD